MEVTRFIVECIGWIASIGVLIWIVCACLDIVDRYIGKVAHERIKHLIDHIESEANLAKSKSDYYCKKADDFTAEMNERITSVIVRTNCLDKELLRLKQEKKGKKK